MIDIKNLDLTKKDFDMLIEGLEHLPHKSDAGEMIGDLMTAMLTNKDNKNDVEKMKREREEKYKKKKEQDHELIEDIRILQGKLLTLKRYLKQEGALKEAEDIIHANQERKP